MTGTNFRWLLALIWKFWIFKGDSAIGENSQIETSSKLKTSWKTYRTLACLYDFQDQSNQVSPREGANFKLLLALVGKMQHFQGKSAIRAEVEKLTVLNPLYMIRISFLVNLVSLHRSSKDTGMGLGILDGSISNTTSSIGLSLGVAILPQTI